MTHTFSKTTSLAYYRVRKNKENCTTGSKCPLVLNTKLHIREVGQVEF